MANEWGIAITVSHYPPRASKWNVIEHRLFSAISGNSQGDPLRDYETVLKFIDTTRSERGLSCRALLDTSDYPKGEKITEAQKKLIRIKRSKVCQVEKDQVVFERPLSAYLWYFHTGEEGFNIGGLFFRPPNAKVREIPIT